MPDIVLTSLKGKTQFDEVFRHSKRFNSTNVVLQVQFQRRVVADTNTVPVGIVVRKKLAATAVLRNRLKRLIRESLRLCKSEHPHYFDGIQTLVIMWNKTEKLAPSQITLKGVQEAILSSLKQCHNFMLARSL